MNWFKSKIETPDWVTAKQRRLRVLALWIGGVSAAFSIWLFSAFLVNIFTHEVDISIFKSALGLAMAVLMFYTAWQIVPTKSVWLNRLENAKSKSG